MQAREALVSQTLAIRTMRTLHHRPSGESEPPTTLPKQQRAVNHEAYPTTLTAFSSASETSASPCAHFTLDNWKEAIRLPGEGLEFGNDAQMWIYMHHGGEDINDSPEFENAFSRLQVQDPNLSCATINCAVDPVLCNSWLASPPTVMHISHEFHTPLLAPRVEWRRIFVTNLNSSAIDMESSYRDQSWRGNEIWDGFLHPYTGALGKYGGGKAWGIFKFWFDKVPRWLLGLVATFMIKRFLAKLNVSDEPMMSAAYQIVPPENLR
ncbi:hypothetical protein V491_08129 [Pseudogymnoascus sp. VKM F-3775]|nr:hypothetical protein V491_08129 [Pseudogymnoascus sp. VKM F-3775]